jgi:hypothetical protein
LTLDYLLLYILSHEHSRPAGSELDETIHLLRVQDGLVVEVRFHNWDDLTVNDFWS